jgi:hypothetical protein
MSPTPPKFTPPISDNPTPQQVALYLRQLYLITNQHDQAIIKVNDKIPTTTTTVTTTTSSSSSIVAGVSTFNTASGDIAFFPNLGQVNDQSGTVAYTIRSTDDGQMILLNDASPIAVTLDSTITIPWYTVLFNQGSGTATMTPTAGTVNGGATLDIPSGGFSIIYFNGTNWFASATNGVVTTPVTFAPVIHQFLTGYSAGTGIFSAGQPAASDLSNGTTGSGTVVLSASPTLTGVPAAPTAAQSTNTTQLATTQFVIGQASNTTPAADSGAGSAGTSALYSRSDHVHPSGGSGPATFTPIVHEFLTGYDSGTGLLSAGQPAASDLSNGTTGSGTVVLATSPSLSTPTLSSPTLTGTPTAPTAALSTNTTQIATTAFVVGQASNATPTTDSGGGSAGVSALYARSDHVHPASVGVNFSDNETPSGTIDGVNVTFTLAHSPSPAASLILASEGMVQLQGVSGDYTLSAGTITFGTAPTLGPLIAWYRY